MKMYSVTKYVHLHVYLIGSEKTTVMAQNLKIIMYTFM